LPDDLVNDHYGWKLHENTNNLLEKTFGATALAFAALSYFAL
jgi:hypothetical protein